MCWRNSIQSRRALSSRRSAPRRAAAVASRTGPLCMSRLDRSIRQHLIAVAAVAAFMVISVGVMGAMANLSGAVISSGMLVVQSNVKKVQHPVGGVVKRLAVDEGARVKAGDLLIRLDEVVARANL